MDQVTFEQAGFLFGLVQLRIQQRLTMSYSADKRAFVYSIREDDPGFQPSGRIFYFVSEKELNKLPDGYEAMESLAETIADHFRRPPTDGDSSSLPTTH